MKHIQQVMVGQQPSIIVGLLGGEVVKPQPKNDPKVSHRQRVQDRIMSMLALRNELTDGMLIMKAVHDALISIVEHEAIKRGYTT